MRETGPKVESFLKLTDLAIQVFIVPLKHAAIPNLPLFKIFMATLNPSPTSVEVGGANVKFA